MPSSLSSLARKRLDGAVYLALGQREHGNDVDSAGQRPGGFRDGRVPGGTRQHVPAGAEVAVELCLDRVQQFRHMLVFIDQDRLFGLDEPSGVGPHGRPGGRVVAVDDPPSEPAGQFAEQGALPDGSRTVQDQHGLLGEPLRRDRHQPAFGQASQHFTQAPTVQVSPFSGQVFPRFRPLDSRFPGAGFRVHGSRATREPHPRPGIAEGRRSPRGGARHAEAPLPGRPPPGGGPCGSPAARPPRPCGQPVRPAARAAGGR